MLAEYENFRKRSQREKDGIYGDAVSDTVAKLLPMKLMIKAART